MGHWPQHARLPRRQLTSWGNERRALVVPNFQRSGHGCRNEPDKLACHDAFMRGTLQMPADYAELRGCIRTVVQLLAIVPTIPGHAAASARCLMVRTNSKLVHES